MGARIKFRKPNGRFVRPPSLEALGVVRVRGVCGQWHVRDEQGTHPRRCIGCGGALTQEPALLQDMPASAK